jgi:hypothetical protein
MRSIGFSHFEKADRARCPVLDRQFKRPHDEQPFQSAPHFALAIHWVETGGLRLRITLSGGATRHSARVWVRSVTGQESTPMATAFSRARPRIRPTRPRSNSNGSFDQWMNHDKRKCKNQRL